jgi:hypothetical protein
MANLSRKDLEVRYEMFDKFSLVDQRAYYMRTIEKHDEASSQVNRIRAMISLFTGASAAVAGLIGGIYFTSTGSCVTGLPSFDNCNVLAAVVDIAILLSVALPALGGFFGTLADLYQWDRQISIYKAAADSIEVADAHSPYEEMDDETYRASMIAYAQGTLQVMSDETAQWGQSIRTPKGLEAYVKIAREKAAAIEGDADANREVEVEPPVLRTVLPDKPVGSTKTSPEPSSPAPSDTATDTGGESSAG